MNRRTLRLDPLLLTAVVGLLALGVLAVSSAASSGPGRTLALEGPGLRQLVLGGLGVLVLLAAASIDYRLLSRVSTLTYVATVLLLGAVLVAGSAAHGSRRWIDLGPLSFQPSEVAKVSSTLALAALFASREVRAGLVAATAMASGLLVVLVLVEPDTGTSLVLGLGWLAMVVAGGAPWRALGGLLGTGLGVVPLAFAVAIPDYQRERLAVFLDPGRDPLGSGFNVRQAEMAIGSGGVTGHGVFVTGDHIESALTHVAARTSDFVFAQVGEDLGLLGTVAIVGLFALIAWRGYSVARSAPDAFGRLLAAGLTSMVVVQAAIHIAVNLRLFPATGITLPLVSTGGTSILVTCAAIGIIESVAAQRVKSRPGRRH